MIDNIKSGDMVWMASCDRSEQDIPCPVCEGHKSVSLVTASGRKTQVVCDFCKEYGSPTGVRHVYAYIPKAKQVRIDRVVITEEPYSKPKKEYHINVTGGSWSTPNRENLFMTEEEALKKAAVLYTEVTEAAEADLGRRAQHNMTNGRHTWASGYHRQNIEELEEKLAYHRRQLCLPDVKIEKKGKKK